MTHGVVTPNMLAATNGFSSLEGRTGAAVTMPAIAAAALPRIRVEIRFSPATSTMYRLPGTFATISLPSYTS